LLYVPTIVPGNLEHLNGPAERVEGRRKKGQSALVR
jgi:hypothetical protein